MFNPYSAWPAAPTRSSIKLLAPTEAWLANRIPDATLNGKNEAGASFTNRHAIVFRQFFREIPHVPIHFQQRRQIQRQRHRHGGYAGNTERPGIIAWRRAQRIARESNLRR